MLWSIVIFQVASGISVRIPSLSLLISRKRGVVMLFMVTSVAACLGCYYPKSAGSIPRLHTPYFVSNVNCKILCCSVKKTLGKLPLICISSTSHKRTSNNSEFGSQCISSISATCLNIYGSLFRLVLSSYNIFIS